MDRAIMQYVEPWMFWLVFVALCAYLYVRVGMHRELMLTVRYVREKGQYSPLTFSESASLWVASFVEAFAVVYTSKEISLVQVGGDERHITLIVITIFVSLLVGGYFILKHVKWLRPFLYFFARAILNILPLWFFTIAVAISLVQFSIALGLSGLAVRLFIYCTFVILAGVMVLGLVGMIGLATQARLKDTMKVVYDITK